MSVTRAHRAVLAMTIAAASLLAGAPGARADDALPETISDGAVTAFDVVVGADGRPTLEVVSSERTSRPQDVVLQLDGDLARTAIPEQVPPFYEGFVSPGATIYQAPAASTPGLPTIGWSTLRAPEVAVDIDLRATGPGPVVVLGADPDGAPVPYLDTRDEQPDELPAGASTNGWLTWLFEEPGTYAIDARPRLADAGVGEVSGDWSRYLIEVTTPTSDPGPPPVSEPPVEPEVPPTVGEPQDDPADGPRDPGGADDGAAAPGAAATGCAVDGLAANATTVADGHFDYGVQVNNGRLRSRIKDDRTNPAQWRAPDSVLFALGAAARKRVPDTPAYGFLGDAGDPVWTIGQTQEDQVPWLGWNTQHPTAVDRIDGPTSWRLDDVDGPGEMFLYQTGSFGGVSQLLGLANGWPRRLTMQPNTHVHGSWSFTRPGTYRVRTTHVATLDSGAEVSSTETLYFQVGPCPDAEPRPDGPLPARLLLADKKLAAGNRHGVRVAPTQVAAGQSVTATVPGTGSGDWLMPVLYSAPRQLGWRQVSPTADLPTLVVPAGTPAGSHKLAFYDTRGLVGWAPLRVQGDAAPQSPVDRPDPEPVPAPPVAPAPVAPPPLTSSCVPSSESPGTGTDNSEPPVGGQDSVSDGHFDFGPEVSGSALTARVKDDRTQPPTWTAPESFRFVLGAAAEQEVPSGASYGFLGAPGDAVWLIPQTQVSGVPWLGWNTQHETVRAGVRGDVRFTLDQVTGPGELAVYLTDSFGGLGQKVFGSAGGFPRSFDVPLNVHAHGNWAFTEPGGYQVVMTIAASLSDGTAVSDQATLTFDVGGSGATPSLGSAGVDQGAVAPAAAFVPSPPEAMATDGAAPDEEPGEPADADAEGSACTLPETGAGPWTSVLLPLGIAMVVTGIGLLLLRRRTAPVLALRRT